MIHVNFRDSRPIYEQVRDNFRQLIISGALPADYKMPSVRELASSLTINPNTIQRAYRELEADGYICTVPGKGSFVCSQDEALAARRAELTGQFKALSKELMLTGLSRREIIELLEGEENDN